MKNPIPVTVQKVETMARHARIQLDTQELISPEQLTELFALHDKVGYFFLFENDKQMLVDTSKLPPIQLEEGEKSPSQRLRATLYVYWQQNKKDKVDFELFYRQQMERIIGQVKERLA